ncbi:MAG: HEPN domain-containing protein [Cyanobacteria bacterium P01_A01_bin.17]
MKYNTSTPREELEHDGARAKIHDLTALLDLLLPREPELETLRFALGMLTDYAVAVRYPGFSADQTIAEEVYGLCEQVRQSIRQRLSLS